jgi:hypothetical protein
MQALVVYESMYGNTRAVAEAIGRGLATSCEVTVQQVANVDAATLSGVDLLVVGGPTHTWSMSRPATRNAAVEAAADPTSGLVVEPGAAGPGIREWLQSLQPPTGQHAMRATAFDTRMHVPLGLNGGASRGIAKRLHRIGFSNAHPPQGFYVTKTNQLTADETARAESWGRDLAGVPARAR